MPPAARLPATPGFRFARRVITRPADAGGEAHEAVTETEFATRRFALSWRAHGLCYGIPADIAGDLAQGRVVVASVSRTAIADAMHFPVRVIEVWAPPDICAARLAARRREDAAGIAERLARGVPIPDRVSVDRVVNDATLQEGAARFLAALSRAAEAAPSTGTDRLPRPA